MPEHAADDTTQTAPARRPSRRFRVVFCRFHAVGIIHRPPAYHHTNRGQASASLSMLTDEDRELDLIVFDRDETTLRRRLDGVEPGARAYAEGAVQAPRLTQRELPQFVAEIIFHTTSNGPGPAHTSHDQGPPTVASTTPDP